LAVCSKCGQQILPHRACPNCGSFKGREVIDVLKKLDKKERKKKEKELASQEKETKQESVSMESLSQK
jgi:large subunit ribosomal protein L32